MRSGGLKRHEPQLAHQSRVLVAIIAIHLENMSGGDADLR